MKVDTRDKKPKPYALIPLTISAVIIILLHCRKSSGAIPVTLTLIGYAFLTVLVLLWAFHEQIRYNPYSYNTIIYFGFALFAGFVMITNIVLLVSALRDPFLLRVDDIFRALLHSAKNYTFITSPFLVVFSTALCISNISLIKHEGKRPVNLLGIALSFILLAGAVFLFVFDYVVIQYRGNSLSFHELFANFFASVYLYFECMLIGTIVATHLAARLEPDFDRKYMIILGCGLRKDGTPTPLLRGRLDRALLFYHRQKEATGKEMIFIVSGGQGPNEVIPESRSMKNYLLSQGIPEEMIVEEDRSTSTYENMKFSKEKIPSDDLHAGIAFVTTNYHVFRGGLCGRRVKMRALGMGARTKWYFWPNAAVREFAGLLVEHRGKQAAILFGMIAFYVGLTVFLY